MNILKNNKKYFLFAIIFLVIVFLIWYFLRPSTTKYGPTINISNFSKVIINLNEDMRNRIESDLYNLVEINGKNPKTVADAIIRKNSVVQTYDKESSTYSGSLIVDIESIRQSYKFKYYYTLSKDVKYQTSYPVGVFCLDKEDIIYKEFNCKTKDSDSESLTDPLLAFLPYETLNYSVKPRLDDKGSVILVIDISLSESDYRSGVENIVSQYKNEIFEWIKSNGLDPNNYQYQYRY